MTSSKKQKIQIEDLHNNNNNDNNKNIYEGSQDK